MEMSEAGKVQAARSEEDVPLGEQVALFSTSSNETSCHSALADGCHRAKHPGSALIFLFFFFLREEIIDQDFM